MGASAGHGAAGGDPKGTTACPTCGVPIRRKNLKKHLRRAHPPRTIVPASVFPRPPGAAPGASDARKPGRSRDAGSEVPDKLRLQLAELKDQLRQISARLKETRSPAKRKKLLAKKRALRSRIDLLDPEREPARFKTWGRWSKGPGSVRFWRGR